MFEIANKYVLLSLILLPALYLLARRVAHGKRGTVRFSDVRHLRAARPSLALRMRGILAWMRLLALALLILAMARPQYGIAQRRIQSEGIDIIVTLDCSGSMQSRDFNPNRLEAAKRVLINFVKGRTSDRIGVIVFAPTSFMLVPLTLDYGVIEDFVKRVNFDIIQHQQNDTAIGLALANSVKKLEDSKAKSKVIVLLTDGQNNSGNISPELAANLAKALKIKVYTIGVGSTGPALAPGMGLFGGFTVQDAGLDEDTLRMIAKNTGGQYFRATDDKSLEKIFKDINKLETTKIEENQYVNYSEQMAWLVWPALGILLLEILLGYTRFLKLP
ncbi:MAG: VWA domain-containing protein [Candidatus Sumerlaeota bacterium]|nr:VWA domain-containing protein [Candidatus Sumerlaeota bacterium]